MIERSYKNVWLLNKSITQLIYLARKIDTREHPQQVDVVVNILDMLDKARYNQLLVTQSYKKTADNLRLERNLRHAKTEPSVSLEEFYDSLPETVKNVGENDNE